MTESELTLETSVQGGMIVGGLVGRATTLAVGNLSVQLGELVAKDEGSILLDCEKLTFMSSSGLRVLLRLAKEVATKNKKLALCSLSSDVDRVFKLSGFDKIIDIYGDKDQALAGLGG